MSDHLTTEDVREIFVNYCGMTLTYPEAERMFDRWLARHRLEVLAAVAAEDPDNLGITGLLVAALARADDVQVKLAAAWDEGWDDRDHEKTDYNGDVLYKPDNPYRAAGTETGAE